MSGRLIAIDTNILVWGVRRQGDPQQLKRARWFFQRCQENEDQIIVPTVALAEYVRPCRTSEERAALIAECDKQFLVLPFDVRAASMAAYLFNEGRKQRAESAGSDGFRRGLNADSLIIATAATGGAESIYSGNEDFRKLASLITRWTVADLPDQSDDLFDQ